MESSHGAIEHGFLRAPLSSLPQAALLVGSDGRILAGNSRARRIFGCQVGETLDDLPITDFVPDIALTDLLHASRQRGSKRRELQGRRRDGEIFPLGIRFALVRVRRSPALFMALTDLTRWKLLQANERDSRHGFRQLALALPQILWTCHPDGTAEYFGPQWVAFTGAPLETHLGKGWLAYVHAEDRPIIERDWDAAAAATRTFKAEFRVRRHDGEYHWFETTIVPLRDRERMLVRWIGILNDIHEAKLNRLALIDERDRFAKLVASAPGVIYAFRLTKDGQPSFPLASAGIKDLLGLTENELRENTPREAPRVHSADQLPLQRSIVGSAKTLMPWHHEWRVLHPQKGWIWVEGHAVPTREADGSTLWYGIMIDVTQRKHAEEELQRSQARLQAAVMASGIGTYIWDAATGGLWWDDTLLKLFDRTREEVERGGIEGAAQFVQPEDREIIANAMDPVREGKTDTISIEYRTLRRDGALQWVAVTGRVERDAAGAIARMTGACMDITKRKRAEDAQRHSQKIEALGTLAGGIAHDFNNLLLAIGGNTRLAISELGPDHPVRRNLEEIDKASVRASDLVHRILAFSHQREPRRAVIDLRPTIEEALRLLRSTLPAMIELRTSFAPETPLVNADSTQIYQVIMNLVTNSAHAIGEDSGLVTVELSPAMLAAANEHSTADAGAGPLVRIRVTDTGCGMNETTRERMFDPFFTTKPVGRGTGLGLSVVHGIVRSHGGIIAVESEPGRGSTFDVYLPPAVPATPAVPAGVEGIQSGGGQRILYVDDEDALVYLVTHTLQRLGYQVSGFTDPAQALVEFGKNPAAFDVVVTDVAMPGMSGFNLSRAVLAIRPDVPIIMTSGYVRPQDRVAAQQIGVRDLILKPDTLDELGRALERLFREHQR